MILSAQSIRQRVAAYVRRENETWSYTLQGTYEALVGELEIEPFHERSVSNGRTFGLSCAGYDVRLAQTLWVWPFWGRLGSIMEFIDLPPDLTCEIKDKSTNARRFITVQNTTAEPGWRGFLTVEITRHLPWPVRIKKGTPIAQVVFKLLDQPTEQPYRGKYQDQPNRPVAAKMERDNG